MYSHLKVHKSLHYGSNYPKIFKGYGALSALLNSFQRSFGVLGAALVQVSSLGFKLKFFWACADNL